MPDNDNRAPGGYEGRHAKPASGDALYNSNLRPSSPYSKDTSPGNRQEFDLGVGKSRKAHKLAYKQFSIYDTRALKRRHRGPHIVLTVLVALVALAAIVWLGTWIYGQVAANQTGGGDPVTVTIPQSSTTSDIASKLKQANVITSESAFKKAVQDAGVDTSLKPGTYNLTTHMDTNALIAALVAGPPQSGNTLTIPEGYNIQQTAAAVESACGIPAADFTQLANSASDYVADYPFLADAYNNSMEGFLFPKTYTIPDGSSADYVIRQMLNQYQTETASLDLSYAQSQGFSAYDVLKIGSLIEKEAAYDDERANISSVIYNRIAAGMRLQFDSTVVYALGSNYDGSGIVTNNQTQVNSPYNTYLVDGLPAGPICSPGLASLQAAAAPASTNYLYFVTTDLQGHLTFCATADEFATAKQTYNQLYGIQ
jgi:UPF0755 protein